MSKKELKELIHTASSTIKFLKNSNIPFIGPDEWPSGSPDLSPCDYWLWENLKSQVNKRKVRTLSGLKRAIADEIAKVPREMVINALNSWSKRVYDVYKAKGGYIEKG